MPGWGTEGKKAKPYPVCQSQPRQDVLSNSGWNWLLKLAYAYLDDIIMICYYTERLTA